MNRLCIDGVAFWAPALPSWEAARAAFRGEQHSADAPDAPALPRRPAPTLLAPAERRRAPDSVALALEVAQRAVDASGHAGAALASVFTSAHGDLGLTDAMCTTLVDAPLAVSPTRFHNSVHNAASGYWTMATGCMRASTAVSAFEHSFAAGLLEACVQCASDGQPVLLVGYDIEAAGALAQTTRSTGLLGVALVLSPVEGAATVAAIDWSTETASTTVRLESAAARALAGNAMADALPFFEALALGRRAPFALSLGTRLGLRLQIDVGLGRSV
jgi:Beta-ketoacyl synthase, N-terminal domain